MVTCTNPLHCYIYDEISLLAEATQEVRGIDMASMVTSDLEDSIDISVLEQSSPESLRARTRALSPHIRNANPSRSTSTYEVEDDYFGPIPVNQCTSSRSSISSFPSSVIHTIPVTDNEEASFRNSSDHNCLVVGGIVRHTKRLQTATYPLSVVPTVSELSNSNRNMQTRIVTA